MLSRGRVVAVALVSLLAPIAAVAVRVNLFDDAGAAGDGAGHTDSASGGEGGHPHADGAATGAVDEARIRYRAPAAARGNQAAKVTQDSGVKVVDLVAAVIGWNILPDRPVAAYAFNRAVPGPLIRARAGDRLRVNVTNALPEPTSVHWHGVDVPNAMDGAGDVTQDPIAPGETFSYDFAATAAGTYFYHSHTRADRQQALGLYGALIVDPADPAADAAYDADVEAVVMPGEWLVRDGETYPAMPADGALPNFFTLNGKAYPATETIPMRVGERLRVRFIGSGTTGAHPMHIHGGPFRLVETDGHPLPAAAQIERDTVNVAPGERYDVIWEARRPGKWLLHCHIPHHTTNDHAETDGGGGMTMVIDVTP